MAEDFQYDGPVMRPWEYEPSFQDILAEQLKKAPWILISLAGHFLIFAFVFLVWQLTPRDDDSMAPPPIQASQ